MGEGGDLSAVAVEICCETLAGVDAACAGGADRVELCVALEQDGLTPPREMVAVARDRCRIGLHVLIRCRAGDFVYEADEVEAMLASIDQVKALGVDGVALGCLTAADRIDMAVSSRLVKAARPLSVTFHRAFDRVQGDGVADLRRLGVDRVLTSGGAATAELGVTGLRRLVEQDLAVIAAGSVRAANVGRIVAATGVRQVHAAVDRLTDDRSAGGLAAAVRALKLAASGG